MKNLFISILALLCINTYAQDKSEIKYRRSSLHLMMIEDANLPEKNTIINTFKQYQDTAKSFPDKYNNHNIGTSSIPNFTVKTKSPLKMMTLADIANMSEQDKKDYETARLAAKAERQKEKAAEQAQKEADKGKKISPEEKKRRKLIKSMKGADKIIEKSFKDQKIANKLVAKWFDMQRDGSMSLNLIKERGSYDATEDDVKTAGMMSKKVSTQLRDAGVELIDKTFVIVNKFKFIENEVAALIIYTAAKAGIDAMKAESKIEISLKNAAAKKAKQLYEKARKGYTVGTQAYLYKLNWSDSTEKVFKKLYWIKPSLNSNEKAERLKAFNNSETFQLEFVGMEKQTIRVLNLTSEDLSKQQIIDEATKRTMNKVYAKLQREYDVFKPRMPLISASKKDCTAKIGLKEGLEGGEKFEVLEQMVNEDGLTTYKSKGIIKVDKKQIWDNQFYANEEEETKKIKNKDEIIVQATGFKGCKSSFYKGMLIKQLK
tara:strand:- start:866 stop:2329 length:1464 start_codon:yes stop_codon:yes gene_type:complete